ncbi:unnamed protein product, partial [Dovyalis caffra]
MMISLWKKLIPRIRSGTHLSIKILPGPLLFWAQLKPLMLNKSIYEWLILFGTRGYLRLGNHPSVNRKLRVPSPFPSTYLMEAPTRLSRNERLRSVAHVDVPFVAHLTRRLTSLSPTCAVPATCRID